VYGENAWVSPHCSGGRIPFRVDTRHHRGAATIGIGAAVTVWMIAGEVDVRCMIVTVIVGVSAVLLGLTARPVVRICLQYGE
jgi:hypothetical protein